MERLTEKVLGFTQLKDCGNDFCKETCAEHDEEKSCDNCPVQKAFEELAGYEDLEEQGKLLKLPCAVGDTVYSFSCGKILILRVDSFNVYADGIDARLVSDMEEYKFLKVELDITDFGKKWFATHEEAEAALKEL